jgi:Mrp family chromosome partitioning ATPase
MDLNARRPSPFIDGAARAGESVTPGVQPIHAAGAAAPHRLDVVPLPERVRDAGVVSAPAARDWLDSMSDRYDWIVLDGPAVLEAPDAPPLASIADGVVIVVEAGRTKRPVLHRAIDLLRKARANLIGSVLNRRRLEIPEFLYRRI